MKKNVVMLIAFLLFPLVSAAQEDYYTKENILKFADYLYQNGENNRAIGEYLRVMALCQDSKLKDTLTYRVAVANIKLSQPKLSRKYCAEIPRDAADSSLSEKAACLMAYSYYQEKKYDSSAEISSRSLSRLQGQEWLLRCAQVRAGSLLKQCKWADAESTTNIAMQHFGGKNDTLTPYLQALGTDGINLHLKSAVLAGVMSAVVPGSGKVYAHRTGDGLFSLLFVASMAWATYGGYKHDGLVSIRCISFGLLGAAFYGGNIYGSINAARLYNQSRKTALCDRVNLQFEW